MDSLQIAPRPSPAPRRLFCDRCSKPLRVCLCCRLKNPPLDNPIAVTVLQHSDEKLHPLNSTRIARLGLSNLAVVPVTDVNFVAHFTVRPIDPLESDSSKTRTDSDQSDADEKKDLMKILDFSDQSDADEKKDLMKKLDLSERKIGNGFCANRSVDYQKLMGKLNSIGNPAKRLEFDLAQRTVEAIFDKYKVFCSSSDMQITIEPRLNPDIGWVVEVPVGRACVSNGFTVSKLQRKQLPGSKEFVDFQEFNIVIPPGTALLFPGGKSTIGLNEVDFEVKHLVVLDGTWKKAQRMYHENPWLKLLPHLKLDPETESLYSEVRHQPKAGCLSTVESIVCALKGLGSDMEGLDDLLDVFESMVGDQRRFKDEKFQAKALSPKRILL